MGRWRAGKPQLTEMMNAFRGTLGIKVVLCRPGGPDAKGLVERANGYLETSFLPGRFFTSPQDFNKQLTIWLVVANARRHRRLQCRPVDRWEADRAAMLELPPVDPVVGWRSATRLPRDHYVRLDANDYSVHPSVIGCQVDVHADLHQVVITAGGAEVAVTGGTGPLIKPSPIPTTLTPRSSCAARGVRRQCRSLTPRCSGARWPITTASSRSAA